MSALDILTICPACKGESPKEVFAFVNTGEEVSKRYSGNMMLYCKVCDGQGNATAAQVARWNKGQEMRKERIERGETIPEAAARMGIRPSELYFIEQGERDA